MSEMKAPTDAPYDGYPAVDRGPRNAFQNDLYNEGYDQSPIGPNDVALQPPPYNTAPGNMTSQPMAGGPVNPQPQAYPMSVAPVNIQNNIIVTSQMQVPRWGHMQFLDNMQHVKMTEVKECCAVCCCGARRKLRIEDEASNPIGMSIAPCQCCSCTEDIYLNIPEGNVVMHTKRPCDCLEYCFPICFCCSDKIVMQIRDPTGMKIGSFDYSPLCCRNEIFCHGKYVIKDITGQSIFRVDHDCCCCACRGVWGLRVPCCGFIPCLACSKEACLFPMCQHWNIPVKISTIDGDTTVSRIRKLNKPWLQQCCCCEPARYTVEYIRPGETTPNKALLLGTAMTMDYYGMNDNLFNDDSIETPYHME